MAAAGTTESLAAVKQTSCNKTKKTKSIEVNSTDFFIVSLSPLLVLILLHPFLFALFRRVSTPLQELFGALRYRAEFLSAGVKKIFSVQAHSLLYPKILFDLPLVSKTTTTLIDATGAYEPPDATVNRPAGKMTVLLYDLVPAFFLEVNEIEMNAPDEG